MISKIKVETFDSEIKENKQCVIRAVHSCRVLDVYWGSIQNDANLIQYDQHNGTNQRWVFEKVGEYHKIVAVHSNKVLDIYCGLKITAQK